MEYIKTENVLPIFMGTWIVLGIISYVFFQFNKNPILKQIVLVFSVIITSTLFIAFAWLMGFRGIGFYVVVLLTILILIMNIVTTSFCSTCGKTLHSQNLLKRKKICATCDVKL